MKILNIFKKATSTSSATKKTNVQKMDKKQLLKVIGGADEATDTKLPASIRGVVIDK